MESEKALERVDVLNLVSTPSVSSLCYVLDRSLSAQMGKPHSILEESVATIFSHCFYLRAHISPGVLFPGSAISFEIRVAGSDSLKADRPILVLLPML